MRKLFATFAVASLLGALALLGGSVATAGGDVSAARTKTVQVGDDFFSPTRVRIRRRDIVRWVFVGEDEHTVTEVNNRFTSPEMTTGVYRRRFRRAGTFRILCALHPSTMRMRVVVLR